MALKEKLESNRIHAFSYSCLNCLKANKPEVAMDNGKRKRENKKIKKSHLFEQQIKSRKSINKEVKTNELNLS